MVAKSAERRPLAHHCAVSDQSDESVLGQEGQAGNDCLLECGKVLLVQAGVNDIEEDGRDLSGPRERVLDGRVLWQELCGEVGVADVLVVGREGVPGEAERADP